MARLDRAVRRARRHLQTDEALLGTVLGAVNTGERSRGRPVLLLATDRRLLLVATRGTTDAQTIVLRDVEAFDVDHGAHESAVRVKVGGNDIAIDRITDHASLEMLSRLVRTRLSRLGDDLPAEAPPKVRIVPN